jgi:signal transduction histidine kinase
MLADDLRELFLLDSLSDAQIDELVEIGEEIRFVEDTILFEEGAPAESWWVLIEGHIQLLRRAGHEVSVIAVMDRPGLWAGGFRAWSTDMGYMTTGRTASAGRVLRVPAAALGERARAWFPFSVHLIEGLFQTVRNMEALSRQREKLVSLGTMAAGLAHEINNPASAIARAVDTLSDNCRTLVSAPIRLAEAAITAEQFLALEGLRREIDPSAAVVDPLALADREEALNDWLEARGIADAWQLAATLASVGVQPEWCHRVADALDETALEPGLEWLAGTLASTALLTEIREANRRVSELVASMKSFSQLDRASMQLVDVTEGLESTLVMLEHKLRAGVTIERDFAHGATRIEADPGELNQVWMNLIDNAIDAMPDGGTLRLSTRVDADCLVAEVVDTGPGMPADVQARAFDAFFTTKDVGKGTGLGLDISRRVVVERHHGEIEIESEPGRTVLRVRLPLRVT